MSEKTKKPANPALIAAVKAVAVLVCICVVCVALLAVLNEVLYISDDERLARAMSKIYPDYELDTEFSADLNNTNAPDGQIKNVYRSRDGAYIIEALGKGGYQNGSVTLYVVVKSDATIFGWAVKENDKQSYIDRVPATAGKTWYVGRRVDEDLQLDMTGATVAMTSTAIYNAVKTAAWYCLNTESVKNELGLIDKVALATDVVKQLLGEEYADYKFSTANIHQNATVAADDPAEQPVKFMDLISPADYPLAYLLVGEKADSDNGIMAYVYGNEDAYEAVAVKENGTVVSTSGMEEKAELLQSITDHRVIAVKIGNQMRYAVIHSYVEDGDNVKYTVSGLKFASYPNSYILEVVVKGVDSKGTVQSVTATVSGFVSGMPSESNANVLLTQLNGATADTVLELYTSHKASGATNSSDIIAAAVLAVLNDFDAKLASGN